MCLLPTTVCIVYWTVWVEERHFAEGIFIILHPFNHANCTSERKLRWDKVNSMSVLSALSSICPPPPLPASPPALQSTTSHLHSRLEPSSRDQALASAADRDFLLGRFLPHAAFSDCSRASGSPAAIRAPLHATDGHGHCASCLGAATKMMAQAIGQSMASLVVLERHLPSKPTLGSQSQQTDHQSPMSALRETIQAVVCEGRSLSLEPGLMGSIARVAGAAQREREALICRPNGSRRLSHCKEHG
ncbi:hypothetical protein Q8A67_018631 [Cirrhinus molitorella]|uniref:Uncharacterized protein n=1 Tax=Cirrhinus molitorella TaxID=172907 RepID=A0AA88PES9_9TELE|nr:hypothetical protein Q8A67_018631 [Cirrhinus molitorella]